MSEKVAFRIAWSCFVAAGVLAIVGVVSVRIVGVTAFTPWLYIAALWLIAPAAWYGLMLFTGHWRTEQEPKSDTPG